MNRLLWLQEQYCSGVPRRRGDEPNDLNSTRRSIPRSPQARGDEPPHVHIDREAFSAKFWLNPVALTYNLGFPARELKKLEALTSEHQKELLEAWNGYFGT